MHKSFLGRAARVGVVAVAALLGAQRASAVVYGLDVYSGNGTMNWPLIAGTGKDFAMVKATEGIGFIDPALTTNETNATAAGIYVGCYDFAHPESNNPVTEADYFVTHASAAGAFAPGKLVPMLDLEKGLGDTIVGASSLSAWARAWCDEVFAKTGAKPTIYVNQNYASNLTSTAAAYPLWLAAYDHDSSLSKGPWSTVTFLQYTSHGKLAGDPATWVDLDQYNGSLPSLISTYVIGGQALPAGSSVPEPASVAAAALIPAFLLGRRRRR